MRFLSTLALTILLTLPAAAQSPDGPSVKTIWCRDATPIVLADCQTTRPDTTDGWLQVAEDGGCLGSPGDASTKPRCVAFTLVDAEEKVPLAGQCTVTVAGGDRSLVERRAPASGVFAVPVWSERMTVACPGFVDAVLTPADSHRTVAVLPGRRVVVTATAPAEPGPSRHRPVAEARLSLHRAFLFSTTPAGAAAGPDADQEPPLIPGRPLDVGSLPEGSYDLRITSDRSAPVVDSFRLVRSKAPLELVYDLPEALCLPLEVSCSGCEAGGVAYDLQRFQPAAGPQPYASGRLALEKSAGGRLRARICGLAAGDYQLSLSAADRVPATQVVTVGPDTSPVEVALAAGTPSRLYLVDGDGVPVGGAEVAVRWRGDERPQRAEVTSDAGGIVEIPPLVSGAPFRAYVEHDGFVPRDVEAVAGDETVVQLGRRGAIHARLVGEACTSPESEVVALVSWQSSEGQQQGHDSYEPESCVFEIPVPQPGTYEVTFRAPDFVPRHETLDLTDSLDADLGDVELERGAAFRVKVRHQGNPVVGAAVRVGREGSPRLSDEGGVVELSFLRDDDVPEEVELFVTHPAFAARRVVARVAAGDEVPVELSDGATVFGTVVTDDGSPAVGESLYASSPEAGMRSTTVDGAGHYELTRLQPGSWMLYRMRVSGPGGGYSSGGMMMGTGDRRVVDLADGERREVDFEPDLEVRGRVSLDGAPVHEPITITAARQAGPMTTVPVPVDDSGHYAVRLPGAGLWLFAYRGARFTASIERCPCLVDVDLVSARQPGADGG